MSDKLAKTTPNSLSPMSARYEPKDFSELARLTSAIVKSGLAPDSVKRPEDAMIIVMTGADLGLNAMQSLHNIHVIKGTPTVSARMKLALVRNSPKCEYFKIVDWTEDACTAETKRVNCDPLRFTFSMKDAKRAGLTGGRGDMYAKYPKQMLWSRCVSTLSDKEYPDVTQGLYTPEEAISIGQVEEASGTADLNDRFSAEPDAVDAEFEEVPTEEEAIVEADIQEVEVEGVETPEPPEEDIAKDAWNAANRRWRAVAAKRFGKDEEKIRLAHEGLKELNEVDSFSDLTVDQIEASIERMQA